jgi:hypothetical protein
VYNGVKDDRNMLHIMKRRNANRIGHNLRGNCRNVTEGKIQGRIEVTEGRGTRRKQLLDDLKETKTNRRLKE